MKLSMMKRVTMASQVISSPGEMSGMVVTESLSGTPLRLGALLPQPQSLRQGCGD